MIGVPINTPLPAWRYFLVRPWLKFWTGFALRAGFGFWPRFTGWQHYREAQRVRCPSTRLREKKQILRVEGGFYRNLPYSACVLHNLGGSALATTAALATMRILISEEFLLSANGGTASASVVDKAVAWSTRC